MGFQGEHTTHGFRASLRTLGRERLGIDVDVLEAQLAHAPKDQVEAAYARVKFREKRQEVMQAWADYLDQLKQGRTEPAPMAKREQRSIDPPMDVQPVATIAMAWVRGTIVVALPSPAAPIAGTEWIAGASLASDILVASHS